MAYTFNYPFSQTMHVVGDRDFWVFQVTPAPGFVIGNISVTLNAAWTGNSQFIFRKTGGATGTQQVAMFYVLTGNTSGAWAGPQTIPSDSTGVQMECIADGPPSFPATLSGTAHVTYNDALPPPPCQYGTQPAPTAGLVTLITDTTISAALTVIGAPWLAVLFSPLIGYALDTGLLCGTGPPPISTITPQSLLEDIGSKLAVLESVLWYSICQCTPAPSGSAPPVPYTPPVIVQPPGWPPPPSYTCSNSDICTTLLLILKRLDELSTSQQINYNQTTTIIGTSTTLNYKPGTVHNGLIGSGTIAISKLVGVRVEITSAPPGLELSGNPPYRWDQGWMSVSDGGVLLLERRIARLSAEWFPPEMQLATTFGYYAYPGVALRMTELLPGP